MVLVIGEILMDVFKDNNHEERYPGGAPFNVACNIAHFDGIVSFLGVVGDDELGNQLYNFSKTINFKDNYIKKIRNLKTTIALVTLHNGERSFCFKREDGTDYKFDIDDIKKIPLNDINIVHFGSLMLSSENARNFLNQAIDYFRQFKNIKISFDVNYRDDIFNENEDAKQYYLNVLKQVDYIKISEDEISFLSNSKDMDLFNTFNENQHVFISLGKNGSMYYHCDKTIKCPSILIKPVDTTGAGDAFYSYILYFLDKHCDVLNNENEIKSMLLSANIVGAYATTKKGAIGVVPTIKELNTMIDECNIITNKGEKNGNLK